MTHLEEAQLVRAEEQKPAVAV